MAYLLHDKRQEGAEAYATTSERVAWTAIRNLPTNGPQTAARMMIDTAQRADELKAAAGVKTTGRKATGGPVYHLSLNYHPDERGGNPSKDDMMKAADEVLKILGVDHLQAVMVCHRDTDHSHVHIVVNRVDPATGKTVSIGPQRGRDVDRWSHDFEVQGGQIFSHDRAAKFAEIDRKRAEHPDPETRKEHVEQKRAEADKAANERAAMSDQAKAWSDASGPKRSQGAILKEKADALKAKHTAERSADFNAYKAAKDALWKQRPNFKAIASVHSGDTRPAWSAFGKNQAKERKTFYANERAFLGVVANAANVIERQGWRWGMKGYLSVLFKAAAEPKAWRLKVFLEHQAQDKKAFAARLNLELDGKIGTAKTAHAAKLDTLNTRYDATRAITTARHSDERAAMSAAWKEYFDRREKAGTRGAARGPAIKSQSVESVRKIRAGKTAADPRSRSATGNVWTKATEPTKPAPLRKPWGEKAKPIDRSRPRSRDRDDFEPEI